MTSGSSPRIREEIARCAADESALCAATATPDEAAICATELVLGADGKPPREIKLLPYGNPMPARDGRVFILEDRAHAERVIAASDRQRTGLDFLLDYDHQSALAAVEGVGGKAPAAAWGKALEARDDGVWLTGVEYTPAAEAALAAREYRYLSPWFYVDKASRLVTWIRNAGLTNSPNLDLPALASQQAGAIAGEDMIKTYTLAAASVVALCAAFAIKPDELDDAKILAAVGELKTRKDDAEAALASVRKDLGVADDGNIEAVLASIATAKTAGAPDPKKFVPKEGYDALAAKVAKIEEDRVLASVDQAVAAGKIAPSMKQWAIDLGKSDEPALAAFIAQAAPFSGGAQLKGDPKPEKGKLTAEEKAICSMTGTPEADFLKTRDGEAA